MEEEIFNELFNTFLSPVSTIVRVHFQAFVTFLFSRIRRDTLTVFQPLSLLRRIV